MSQHLRCERPRDLTHPVRIDPSGRRGPTAGQAKGPHWERVGRGLYVPTMRAAHVEQRILDRSAGLPEHAGITGWASLRWQGAAFLDGRRGQRTDPVPWALGQTTQVRPRTGVQLMRATLDPADVREVDGLRVTSPVRAAIDEVIRRGELRSAVVALDMAIGARLLARRDPSAYRCAMPRRTGVYLLDRALALAVDRSWSPGETASRLVWVLDAGLPRPLCNVRMISDDGLYLGRPDLVDIESGLCVEYDGDWHQRTIEDRRRDTSREERFLDHGLTSMIVYGPDLRDRRALTSRMHAARSRAVASGRPRRWQLLEPIPSDVRVPRRGR